MEFLISLAVSTLVSAGVLFVASKVVNASISTVGQRRS